MSPKIVIRNCHQKLSSKIVIRNCHQKLSLTSLSECSMVVFFNNGCQSVSYLSHSVTQWQGTLLSCLGTAKKITKTCSANMYPVFQPEQIKVRRVWKKVVIIENVRKRNKFILLLLDILRFFSSDSSSTHCPIFTFSSPTWSSKSH